VKGQVNRIRKIKNVCYIEPEELTASRCSGTQAFSSLLRCVERSAFNSQYVRKGFGCKSTPQLVGKLNCPHDLRAGNRLAGARAEQPCRRCLP
jgi:hypothetical protein